MTYGCAYLNQADDLHFLVVEPDDYRLHDTLLSEMPPDYVPPALDTDVDVFEITVVTQQEAEGVAAVSLKFLGRLHMEGPAFMGVRGGFEHPKEFCENLMDLVQTLTT